MENQFDPLDSKNWLFSKNGEFVKGESLSLQERYNCMLVEEKKFKDKIDLVKKECFLNIFPTAEMLRLMGVDNTLFGSFIMKAVAYLGNMFAMEKLQADWLEEEFSGPLMDTPDPQ